MFSRDIHDFICKQVSEHSDNPVTASKFQQVSGGSINQTYQLTTNQPVHFFIKMNSADRYPGLFEKEKNGLLFLSARKCIAIPSVIFCGSYNSTQLLILEWIDSGSRTENFWKQFGQQLAQLHHCSHNHFGLEENNYMGSLPQQNDLTGNWIDFFIQKRLQPQIELGIRNNLLTIQHVTYFQKLYNRLPTIFNTEKPSLLHGDLWNGNYICNENSQPVLIDPAVYFGHRSVDLGMTTLFGGFDRSFYDAYHYHYPLPSNYAEQWEVANLYPLLIHLNLFGSSYLGQIHHILKEFTG